MKLRTDLGWFNLYDEELKSLRYNSKMFFDKVELPYDMENLDKNIEEWLEDDSKGEENFNSEAKKSYFKKILSN